MINVDLTKAFHPKLFEVLAPLLPGFFFEGSVLVGRPELVYVLGLLVGWERYVVLFFALLAAFVIGGTLLLWVRLLEILFFKLYRIAFDISPGLLMRLVHSADRRRVAAGLPPQQVSPYERFVRWARLVDLRMGEDADRAVATWARAAKVRLQRLGVGDPGRRMADWRGVVGGISVRNLRSPFPIMELHALAWGGLIAGRVVPDLGWLYRDACLFLIFMGLVSDSAAAWYNAHPVNAWRISARNVLDELARSGGASTVEGNAEQGDAHRR